MRFKLAAALTGAFALVACGGTDADTDGDGTISQEEMAAEVADVKINPGEWENTVEFVEIDFDDSQIPEEARGFIGPALEQMRGRVNTTKSCITPEEAEQPAAEMFAGDENADCEYKRFKFSGGDIDMAMTCNSAGSGNAEFTATGSYTENDYTMDMQIEMSGTPMGAMSIAANTTGKRLGECPG